MSLNLSSMFESITDENKESKSTLKCTINCNRNVNINKPKSECISISFESIRNTEVLFDLFPLIFMSYLDVDTFCNLLQTDLWNWYHLLSERIIYDYCHYISIRNSSEINKFCLKPFESLTINDYSDSYDSSDTTHDYLCYHDDDDNDDDEQQHQEDDDDDEQKQDIDILSNIDDFDSLHIYRSDLKNEEQNFAILKLKMNTNQDINDCFIFRNFKNIDIISDRMSLTDFSDIGLAADLCKNVEINSIYNYNHNHNKLHQDDIIFVYDTFDELENVLIAENFYTQNDLNYIRNVLLMDILSMCPINKWYFGEWHEIKGEYIEDDHKRSPIMEIKQMIIGHFDCKFNHNHNHNHSINQQLFIVWGIEWQQILLKQE